MSFLAGRIANPAAAGRILALDVLVHNAARHARNLLAQPQANGSVLLWAIDADEALIGYPNEYTERTTELPSVHNHARGLPIDTLAEGARVTACRAAALDEGQVSAMVDAACSLAGEPRAWLLASALSKRAGVLPDLVEHYLQTLRGLA